MIAGWGWTVALAFIVLAGVMLWAMPVDKAPNDDDLDDEG